VAAPKIHPVNKIYIDRSVEQMAETRAVCSRLNAPRETVAGPSQVFEKIAAAEDPAGRGKEVLLLTRNRGAFLKRCPGTRWYTCCDYWILHVGTYCSMDCSYCILQSYFHPPVMQYFVNHEDMYAELEGRLEEGGIRRIGTGEFTDSLIWERWTGLAARLVPFFAKQSRAVLELKTKTTAVDGLQGLVHRRKTIVSWSLNTPWVIKSQERRTASLGARIEAAARCAAWGYPLGFHFDPLVIYPGCEDDYRRTIRRLLTRIPAERIVWISLGSFRFPATLKAVIQRRFPQSRIIYEEFVPGMDGKMRYFKPLRTRLYRRITEWIREAAPGVLVYFCMEDEQVWQKVLGFSPARHGGLPAMLDARAMECCGLEGQGIKTKG